ncbi:hypothetical protein BB934_43060 (plasmid) [Microvirga ossetica]|uniref:Uncharacterized protein n=1 Tax=Microvirga ossetica TaxID=1882682 RepID=A0A1B2EYE6_9HYPH|nr:hypothetical protein BB934_43060 [Microvirga ossetica]
MGSDLAIGCTAPTAGIWFRGHMEQMESMTPDGLGSCVHAKARGQRVTWIEQTCKEPFMPRQKAWHGTVQWHGADQTCAS